jgi:hypothetical protein
MAGSTILVNVQTIRACASTFAPGIVKTRPARVPKVPDGFPDTVAFVSMQFADVMVKLVVMPSVIVTALPVVVTGTGTNGIGSAVDGDIVEIDGGVERRFVEVKVNAPPAAPKVIFCTATVGAFTLLVSVHVICAAARMLAAGMVTTFPASVPNVAGLPVTVAFASVQLTDEATKPAAGVSVIVTAVFNALTVLAVGTAGVATP